MYPWVRFAHTWQQCFVANDRQLGQGRRNNSWSFSFWSFAYSSKYKRILSWLKWVVLLGSAPTIQVGFIFGPTNGISTLGTFFKQHNKPHKRTENLYFINYKETTIFRTRMNDMANAIMQQQAWTLSIGNSLMQWRKSGLWGTARRQPRQYVGKGSAEVIKNSNNGASNLLLIYKRKHFFAHSWNRPVQKVIAHAKEYGFVFRQAIFTMAWYCVWLWATRRILKNNIRNYWWKSMVQLNDNIVGLDAAIFMHPTTWKASGHVDTFNDPLIDNKDSKKRYRADVLIEDYIAKLEGKSKKKSRKLPSDLGMLLTKSSLCRPILVWLTIEKKQLSSVLEWQSHWRQKISRREALIEELEIVCPFWIKKLDRCQAFNLMFGTKLGASTDHTTDLYYVQKQRKGFLSTFWMYKNPAYENSLWNCPNRKGIRNEIVARQFITRMREFEQMEMQFFIPPGSQKKWYDHWKTRSIGTCLGMGRKLSISRSWKTGTLCWCCMWYWV